MPALYAAITPHGYGHAAITVAVLNALLARRPDLRLAVVGGPNAAWMTRRLVQAPALADRRIDDPGMVNADPNTVLADDSLARHRALFARWDDAVEAEAARQRAFAPDLVLSNVGAVPLAAARRLGIPAMALAPFHWAQILGAYCGDRPEAEPILARMGEVYAAADRFIATTPFVPMDLPNVTTVGPVCATAAPRRADLRAALGVGAETRVGLIAMGGIGGGLPVETWPRFPGWRFIVCGPDKATGHPDVVSGDALPLSFTELVASVDVVLTKPGYGTVTECACAGTPILYRSRNDWPETPHMMGWAGRHVAVAELADCAWQAGDLEEKLQTVLQAPPGVPAAASGAEEAVGLLLDALAGGQ